MSLSACIVPPCDLAGWHRALARFDRQRLSPRSPGRDWRGELIDEHRLHVEEVAFVESERAAVDTRAAAAPSDPDAFVAWFAALAAHGPGQGDPLFPWLAEHADAEAMRWFIAQEAAGEAGFDDLVALASVRLPVRAKLELARNYWDEVGRGRAEAMHTTLLQRLVGELDVANADAEVVWEALALGNLMVALAANRRYAWQALGALGVIELTAPGRVALVERGLRRLGVSAAGRRYHAVHASLDREHSAAWNREVLRPLVAADPAIAGSLAEGALMRLEAGRRCYERYRRELGVDQPTGRSGLREYGPAA